MATINEIKQQAEAVKNATNVGENTAMRVGGALSGLADIAEQHDSKLSDLSSEIRASLYRINKQSASIELNNLFKGRTVYFNIVNNNEDTDNIEVYFKNEKKLVLTDREIHSLVLEENYDNLYIYNKVGTKGFEIEISVDGLLDYRIKDTSNKLNSINEKTLSNTNSIDTLFDISDERVINSNKRDYSYESKRLKKGATVSLDLLEIQKDSTIQFYLYRADKTFEKISTLKTVNKRFNYTLQEDFEKLYLYNNIDSAFTFSISINGGYLSKYELNKAVLLAEDKLDLLNVRCLWNNYLINGQSFSITDKEYFKVGKTISIKLIGNSESTNNIQVYLYREDKSYIKIGNLTDIDKELTYKLSEDFSYLYFYNTVGSSGFEISFSVDSLDKRIKALERKKEFAPFVFSAKTFRRVACIGDSYTSGHIEINETPVISNPEYSWVYYAGKITGQIWDNYGQSGSTAKRWVLGGAKLSEVQKEGNKAQAYIVGLGINDRGNWSGEYDCPLGTTNDIGTDADSFYAYYYKLIQSLVSVNPEAKIFCNTCPMEANQKDKEYNIAIREIVSFCKGNKQNVYLCDLASDDYNNESYYQNPLFLADHIGGHQTAIGYEFMAECYIKIMSDVINSNIKEFKNIFSVPMDEL